MRTTGRRFTIDAALLILLVGFGFSLAANLLWTWPGGVVRILGGALASLALPGAIHLWPRIPVAAPVALHWCGRTVDVPVMRTVRALAMTGIACMAAFTTFSHASALLVEHGETPLLATLYPVMTELLVVMGVLARHTHTAPAARRAPKPAESPRKSSTPTEAREPGRDESPLEFARRNWPVSGGQIKLSTGCSKGYAYKVAAQVRDERAS